MEAVGFSLMVMLATPGRKATWVPMSDYDTEQQCEDAKTTTLDYWNEKHGPEYRVKFEAECIIIAGGNN